MNTSGTNGTSVAQTSWTNMSRLNGTAFISLMTEKALPRSASDWMSPVPSSCLPVVVGAAQPAPVEVARVLGGEGPVLPQPWPFRGEDLRREDRERPEHEHHADRDEEHDLQLEVGERRAFVEDPARDQAGDHGAERGEQRRVGVGAAAEEAEAAVAVGMGRDQVELDPRHLPEEPRPDHEPEEPAQQQELQDRIAHPGEPEPGER